MQGYLFGKPVTPEETAKLLRSVAGQSGAIPTAPVPSESASLEPIPLSTGSGKV